MVQQGQECNDESRRGLFGGRFLGVGATAGATKRRNRRIALISSAFDGVRFGSGPRGRRFESCQPDSPMIARRITARLLSKGWGKYQADAHGLVRGSDLGYNATVAIPVSNGWTTTSFRDAATAEV